MRVRDISVCHLKLALSLSQSYKCVCVCTYTNTLLTNKIYKYDNFFTFGTPEFFLILYHVEIQNTFRLIFLFVRKIPFLFSLLLLFSVSFKLAVIYRLKFYGIVSKIDLKFSFMKKNLNKFEIYERKAKNRNI